MKKVYFAGKVKKGGWRDTLLGAGSMSRGEYTVEFTLNDKLRYVGPHALGCDHGCYHIPGSHGVTSPGACQCLDHEVLKKQSAVYRCVMQIEIADIVVAYIEDLSAYGTFAEIGYASAKVIPTSLWISPDLQSEIDELWFLKHLPNVYFMGYQMPSLYLATRLIK